MAIVAITGGAGFLGSALARLLASRGDKVALFDTEHSRERATALAKELGGYVHIAPFTSSKDFRDAVAATPLGQFMLETDCPYLAPVPYRGKRCEPAYVKEISETVAQVKLCSLEELSKATCKTAHEFFPKLV